ncbi:MAG: hypothetical protein LBM02_09445 [Lachnospiraceae bacterium]|jgi:hypothetical protein|nr:hypothetical protein [Lachnospiraceae bacterium]
MSIRLKEDTIEAFREIKEIYELKSLDEAAKLAIHNTPISADIVKQPPAFILRLFEEDDYDSFFQETVTWSMLKKSNQGDVFDFEDILKEDASKFETATVLFKDDKGVFIRFELHEKDEESVVDVAFYSFT